MIISRANEVFTKLVEKTNIPVVTTVMGRGQFRQPSDLYIGNLGMHGAYACNMAVSDCDLLFSIGTRFNDRITGKLHSFAPNAQIVHIDIDTAAISKNVQVDIPIVADAKDAIEKMLEYVEPNETSKWLEQIESWKEEHPLKMKEKPIMTPQDIMETINVVFKEDDNYCNRCRTASDVHVPVSGSELKRDFLCPADLEQWDMDSREQSERRLVIRMYR